MIVIFVSQCEKKALKRTRRVLDAFAARIGRNTWQTVITSEGLKATHTLLRKTASKNTAVSCHWIRSRTRSDLLWTVGNPKAFSVEGVVPVNSTTIDHQRICWENNWLYLPLIRACVVFAALFHDWGKCTNGFQRKIAQSRTTADVLRHEWVSCLLVAKFVRDHTEDFGSDIEWLTALEEGKIIEIDPIADLSKLNSPTPLNNLPPFATMVAWLVLTHHRLPLPEIGDLRGFEDPFTHYKELFDNLACRQWGYGKYDQDDEALNWLRFDNGWLANSSQWTQSLKKWARKTLKLQDMVSACVNDQQLIRVILMHARLSLMLGDHHFSSLPKAGNWITKAPELFANTHHGKLNQYLDEHLLGVSKSALNVVNRLPAFEATLSTVSHKRSLKRKSPPNFVWQDKAVEQIITWRTDCSIDQSTDQFGFFAVNMASTGKGKTFANAKIMQSLSPDQNSLRFILALGLRTLTLQTAHEYRTRIGLDKTELGVLIGSKAFIDLGEENTATVKLETAGSESSEELFDSDIDYENIDIDVGIENNGLKTVITSKKQSMFLHAPVLACTIDHMMPVVDVIRGGKYILPYLRLMSSDLVIDEIDDFGISDLRVIGRLVHLAGMLGRKIMISSATIPPDLAKGLFTAYFEGWLLFAKSRGIKPTAGCAWIDEFRTTVDTVSNKDDWMGSYSYLHDNFVKRRIQALKKQPILRKAQIYDVVNGNHESESDTSIYYESIRQAIVQLHNLHATLQNSSGKRISFGVVRVANIKPCVEISQFLIKTDWPEDIAVRVMTYHSSQVLLMRSEQEKHLDSVLNRTDGKSPFQNPLIEEQIQNTDESNLIYILVATPVEEVGRDHDFDWGVIEPSSYRSIIQLSGRVLRHRNDAPQEHNIALMNFNIKGFKQLLSGQSNSPVFCRPGYESSDHLLEHHDLYRIVDESSLRKSVDAIPRISRSLDLKPTRKLIDLEHFVIEENLNYFCCQGANTLGGWVYGYWWLVGIAQRLNRFRCESLQDKVYLLPKGSNDNLERFVFCKKDDQGNFHKIEIEYRIDHDHKDWNASRMWLLRDYKHLLAKISCFYNIEYREAASRFGEISMRRYRDSDQFTYSPQFGLFRN